MNDLNKVIDDYLSGNATREQVADARDRARLDVAESASDEPKSGVTAATIVGAVSRVASAVSDLIKSA